MLEPALKKIHSFVREMYPLHWLICHVNTFECLEGMVGRKSMYLRLRSLFSTLVLSSKDILRGLHTLAQLFGPLQSLYGMTVFERNIEE